MHPCPCAYPYPYPSILCILMLVLICIIFLIYISIYLYPYMYPNPHVYPYPYCYPSPSPTRTPLPPLSSPFVLIRVHLLILTPHPCHARSLFSVGRYPAIGFDGPYRKQPIAVVRGGDAVPSDFPLDRRRRCRAQVAPGEQGGEEDGRSGAIGEVRDVHRHFERVVVIIVWAKTSLFLSVFCFFLRRLKSRTCFWVLPEASASNPNDPPSFVSCFLPKTVGSCFVCLPSNNAQKLTTVLNILLREYVRRGSVYAYVFFPWYS